MSACRVLFADATHRHWPRSRNSLVDFRPSEARVVFEQLQLNLRLVKAVPPIAEDIDVPLSPKT
jgi:hypothetical protein